MPDQPLLVRASADDLAAAVDALLENVFAHTPEGTGLAVRLTGQHGGGGRLVVADEGPGIPATAVERGHSGTGSTGLGLDIVRRTARDSGGTVAIGRAPAGGALVTVEFGPPYPRRVPRS